MDTGKEKQFIVLSKEEVESMIQQAAVAGAQVATDTMLVAQRRAEKERIDRRLHNTELLLRNYRTLKASCENAVYESRDSKREEVTEMLEDIMEMKDDKVIVESIYTNSAGITRYSPLAEWRHEDILAYIHYYDVKLPPIYDWEKGYLCGTHPWPARQYMATEQQGWTEVYNIDKSIVEEAAQYFDGAADFLKTIR